MKRNILLFLCAFLATIGVCAGVFMLLKHRANLQAEEAAAQAAATAGNAQRVSKVNSCGTTSQPPSSGRIWKVSWISFPWHPEELPVLSV